MLSSATGKMAPSPSPGTPFDLASCSCAGSASQSCCFCAVLRCGTSSHVAVTKCRKLFLAHVLEDHFRDAGQRRECQHHQAFCRHQTEEAFGVDILRRLLIEPDPMLRGALK